MNVSPSGGGDVEVEHHAPSSYPYTYPYPGVVEVLLEAVPAPGYDFVSWSGHLTGSTNPVDVTVDCSKSITANFSVKEDSGWAYDTNGINGIQKDEAIAAILDYFNLIISKVQVINVLVLYFSGAG